MRDSENDPFSHEPECEGRQLTIDGPPLSICLTWFESFLLAVYGANSFSYFTLTPSLPLKPSLPTNKSKITTLFKCANTLTHCSYEPYSAYTLAYISL